MALFFLLARQHSGNKQWVMADLYGECVTASSSRSQLDTATDDDRLGMAVYVYNTGFEGSRD
jgi:hypothetical protein